MNIEYTKSEGREGLEILSWHFSSGGHQKGLRPVENCVNFFLSTLKPFLKWSKWILDHLQNIATQWFPNL